MTNNQPSKANLGCDRDYRDGWHNVDHRDTVKADERVNLDEIPWPWDDNRFDHVLMDNVIEHLNNRLQALEELKRIVEPRGSIVLRFPHWNSSGHYSDPTHTKTLTHKTFRHDLVSDLFVVDSVDCTRVRFGRALPKSVALWLADHIGHIVSEVEVILSVQDPVSKSNTTPKNLSQQ